MDKWQYPTCLGGNGKSSSDYLPASFLSDDPGGDWGAMWQWVGIFGKLAPLKEQTQWSYRRVICFDLAHLLGQWIGAELDWAPRNGSDTGCHGDMP